MKDVWTIGDAVTQQSVTRAVQAMFSSTACAILVHPVFERTAISGRVNTSQPSCDLLDVGITSSFSGASEVVLVGPSLAAKVVDAAKVVKSLRMHCCLPAHATATPLCDSKSKVNGYPVPGVSLPAAESMLRLRQIPASAGYAVAEDNLIV